MPIFKKTKPWVETHGYLHIVAMRRGFRGPIRFMRSDAETWCAQATGSSLVLHSVMASWTRLRFVTLAQSRTVR